MSYSNSFPTQRPTLNLDFANSGKLDSRISYSRSSTGTALSSERHLSSENLLTYSNDLSGWTSTTTTTPSTNNLAPDGTNTATAVIEDTATSGHNRYAPFPSVSGTNYTFLAFAKANGRTKFQLIAQATSTIADVTFDLTAETSTVTAGSAVSHSITPIGSTGWYRCEVTVTATGTGSNAYHQVNLLDATGAISYTGDGVSGLYFWGMQVSSTGETVLNETSGQIHREFAPTLKTFAADGPRFEYTADGESEGLLIEAQATNKATYSEDFTNAVYNKYRATIEPASAIAPDGTLTASFLREDATASNTHYFNTVTNTGLSVGTTKYAVSIFVKAAGRSRINMYDNNQNTPGTTTFDLSSGTVVTGDGSIQSCGNGWFRCTIIPTCDYSATSAVYILLDNGSGTSYTGNSYSGILVWGYQLETGVSASSSYIKSNSGSSTTRSADSCSVDLSQINYSGGDTSVVIDIPVGTGKGHLPYLFDLGGSNVQQISFYKSSFTASANTNWNANAAGNALSMSGSSASGTLGLRVSTDNFRADSSNSAAVTDSSITVSPWTSLHLGSANTGGYQLNGHIKRLALYNVALSDTELQALTS